VVFGGIAIVVATVITIAALFAADLFLHKRVEKAAGLNAWGYRGPAVGRKKPGEIRVVVLGGSTAFGYGVTWDHAYPAILQQRLNETGTGQYTVVNLGYNSEGVYSFHFTLQDFAYLDYDVVLLYEGYNDIIGDQQPNLAVYRHDSPIFRLTGYFPILPLVFREKAMAMRTGGNLNSAYAGEKVVFQPDLSVRISAAALDAASTIGSSVERQLDRLAAEPRRTAERSSAGGCAFPWNHYCQSIGVATDYALAHHKKVIVVAQPRMTPGVTLPLQTQQQAALSEFIERKYPNSTDVKYLDLRDAVNLGDADLAPDAMHLSYRGNSILAGKLVDPVLNIVGRTRAGASR
jgi:hypothetical protein